jgi:hypothetical protein
MKTLNAFLLLILSVTFFQCDNSDNNHPKEFSIVFCDLTKSVKNSVADSVISRTKSIYYKQKSNSSLYIYPISQATTSDALIKAQKETELNSMTATPSDIDDFEKGENKKQQDFLDEIGEELKDIYINARNADNSCIINKLEKAYDVFKSQPQNDEGQILKLYILSDMIEDCDNSFVDNFSMEKKSDFEEIKKRIEEDFNPIYNLAGLGVEIQVVFSDTNTSKNIIPYNQLKELWTIIFKKIGYSNNEGYIFTTGL